MNAPMRVYLWCDSGTGSGAEHWMALAEDGEAVTSHICSSAQFARLDLHDRKAADYQRKFGPAAAEGVHYELAWQMPPAEVIQRHAALVTGAGS